MSGWRRGSEIRPEIILLSLPITDPPATSLLTYTEHQGYATRFVHIDPWSEIAPILHSQEKQLTKHSVHEIEGEAKKVIHVVA